MSTIARAEIAAKCRAALGTGSAIPFSEATPSSPSLTHLHTENRDKSRIHAGLGAKRKNVYVSRSYEIALLRSCSRVSWKSAKLRSYGGQLAGVAREDGGLGRDFG